MTNWRKSWLILLLLISLLTLTTSVFARDTLPNIRRAVSTKLIMVTLYDSNDITDLNRRYKTITVDDGLSFVGVFLLRPTLDTQTTVNQLRSDARTLFAEVNQSESLVDEMIYADPSAAWAWAGMDPQPARTQ